MDPLSVIDKLEINQGLFVTNLSGITKSETLFRPNPNHWCLLEIICHMVDEEKLDFRTRVLHCLKHPEIDPPAFDPLELVKSGNYMEQDFKTIVDNFSNARKVSIIKLRKLVNPKWQNGYFHKYAGRMTAHSMLNNWLAHDYLHLRQITKVKYEYLKSISQDINFKYAGKWVL